MFMVCHSVLSFCDNEWFLNKFVRKPHNKALKSDCKPVAVLVQLASVFTAVILGLVVFAAT